MDSSVSVRGHKEKRRDLSADVVGRSHEFSTDTSAKDTNLSLQQLIEYCETKEYVVKIFLCVFRDLNSLITLFHYKTARKLYKQHITLKSIRISQSLKHSFRLKAV